MQEFTELTSSPASVPLGQVGAGKSLELPHVAASHSRDEGLGPVVWIDPLDEPHRLVPFVTPEFRSDLYRVLSVYDERGEDDQLDCLAKLRRSGLEFKTHGDAVQQRRGLFDTGRDLREEIPVSGEVVLGERGGHC